MTMPSRPNAIFKARSGFGLKSSVLGARIVFQGFRMDFQAPRIDSRPCFSEESRQLGFGASDARTGGGVGVPIASMTGGRITANVLPFPSYDRTSIRPPAP